jgi:FixJ family two-component response regulator
MVMTVNSRHPKIVIIHDDLSEDDPLLVELRDTYGSDNVTLKKESQGGLDYVLANLSEKAIVILDLTFKANEPSGVDVFDKIRERTSLIYIIVLTAKDVHQVAAEDLVKFINNDALAFIPVTDSYQKVLEAVARAAHELDTSVPSVLEQWISRQSDDVKNAPYVTTETGKRFTLGNLLDEIRKQTAFGKKMEKNILLLAVDLLTRQKERIDD